MPSFKHYFNTPSSDFTHASAMESLDVRIGKPNPQGDCYFSVKLPDRIFKQVVGSLPEYGEAFTPYLQDQTFAGLLAQFRAIVSDAMAKPTDEENFGAKTLFVFVRANEVQRNDNIYGARMERLQSIEFGYFQGWHYEHSEPDSWHPGQFKTYRRIYAHYTPAGYGLGAPNPFKKQRIVLTTDESVRGHTFADFQSRYRFIPYTEEREAFLAAIEGRLGAIVGSLDTFFGGITADGLDLLIANNSHLLASSVGALMLSNGPDNDA